MDTPQTPQPLQSVPPFQPAAPPPVSIPPTVQNKSPWPIVIASAVVLILGYGILAWSANLWPFSVSSEVAVSPTPSASATPDVTAGWKTYTNAQYGFEFKYPANWFLSGAGALVDDRTVNAMNNGIDQKNTPWIYVMVGSSYSDCKDNDNPLPFYFRDRYELSNTRCNAVYFVSLQITSQEVSASAQAETAFKNDLRIPLFYRVLSTFKFTK